MDRLKWLVCDYEIKQSGINVIDKQKKKLKWQRKKIELQKKDCREVERGKGDINFFTRGSQIYTMSASINSDSPISAKKLYDPNTPTTTDISYP